MITRRRLISASAASVAALAVEPFTHNATLAGSASDLVADNYLAGAHRVYTADDNAAYWRLLEEQSHALWFVQAYAFVYESEQAATQAFPPLTALFQSVFGENRMAVMEEFVGDDPALGSPWLSWGVRGTNRDDHEIFSGCLHWQRDGIVYAIKGQSFQDTVLREMAMFGQSANSMDFRNRPVTDPTYEGDVYRGGAFDVLPGFRQLVRTKLMMRPENDTVFSLSLLQLALQQHEIR